MRSIGGPYQTILRSASRYFNHILSFCWDFYYETHCMGFKFKCVYDSLAILRPLSSGLIIYIIKMNSKTFLLELLSHFSLPISIKIRIHILSTEILLTVRSQMWDVSSIARKSYMYFKKVTRNREASCCNHKLGFQM